MSAILDCAVVSNPAATITWYRNGVLIAGETGATYTFNPTAADQNVAYECRATNDIETTMSLALTVISE